MSKLKAGSFLLVGLLLAVIVALGWWNRDALLALLQPSASPDQGRPPPLVEVAPAERTQIEARLRATGTLKAAETVTITARSRGRVESLQFEEGEPVTKHQALVLLERERADAGVQQSAARASQSARQLERLEQLDAQSFVSETELEEARATAREARATLRIRREDLADRTIEAPFDGVIGRRRISPGALLEPGMAIASLSRIAPLDLLLNVPGIELARIELQQRVLATTPAYPGETFQGRVTFISPEVAEGTRSLAFEATFDNADHRLKPGMFMTAELVTDRREILRVPEAAVIAQGPSEHLFVVDTSDAEDSSESAPRVRRQPVQTGIRRDGWIEITSGVSADERVVVAGLQRLRDGMPVRISGDQEQSEAPLPGPGRAADDAAEPSGSSAGASSGASADTGQSTQGNNP